MNEVIWSERAVQAMKTLRRDRAARLRREVDSTLVDFGYVLLYTVRPLPASGGLYVWERGGLRAFFRRHSGDIPAIEIVGVEDASPHVSAPPPPRVDAAPIHFPVTKDLVGWAREAAETALVADTKNQIFFQKLAVHTLSDYLHAQGYVKIHADHGYMADPLPAEWLGLAELEVSGLSLNVVTAVSENIADEVPIPRQPFALGFISDIYVFTQVTSNGSQVTLRGFLTDAALLELKVNSPSDESDRVTIRWNQLRPMAELAGFIKTRAEVFNAIPAEAPGRDAGPQAEVSVTSAQLGQTLFGEWSHEQAGEHHFSYIKGWLSSDVELSYLGHVLGCAACCTALANTRSLRTWVGDVANTVSEPIASMESIPAVQGKTRYPVVDEPTTPRQIVGREGVPIQKAEPETALVPVGETRPARWRQGALQRVTYAVARYVFVGALWVRQHPVKAAINSAAFVLAAGLMFWLPYQAIVQRRSRVPDHIQRIGAYGVTAGPDTLIVKNAKDQEIFRQPFYNDVRYWPKLVDLNGDGYLDMVIGMGGGENAGKIFVYSFDADFLSGKRKEPLISPAYETYRELQFSYYSAQWSGQSVVLSLVVDDLFHDGRPRILATWTDRDYAGSALDVLRMPGKTEEGLVREAEYIHPGRADIQVVTIDRQKKILFYGVNNALRGTQLPFEAHKYYHVIGLLDPRHIWGEAPPYLPTDVKKGSQEWYGFVEPIGVSIDGRSITIRDIDGDGRDDILMSGLMELDGGRKYSAAFLLDPDSGSLKAPTFRLGTPESISMGYRLYDPHELWWLGREEYDRRSANESKPK